MSLPDDWAWLDDINEWSIPEELRRPAVSPEVNLAITILSWEAMPHDIIAETGRFVTESAQYTTWFHKNMKHSNRDLTELSQLMAVRSHRIRRVHEAWQRIIDAHESDEADETVGERVIAARAALAEALHNAVAESVRIREAQPG